MPPKRARSASIKKASTPDEPPSPISPTKLSTSRLSSPKKVVEKSAEVVKDAVKRGAQPQAHGYEFGGPILVTILTLFLPVLCYILAFVCNDVSGCPAPVLLAPRKLFKAPLLSTKSDWQHGIDTLKREVGWPGLSGLVSIEGFLGTLSWYGLSLALLAFLPSYDVEGAELKIGGRLKYRFNAFLSAVAIVVTCAAGTLVRGPDFAVWSFINRNYIQILTSNIIISYALAIWVYVKSFSVKSHNREKRELAAGGHTGNMLYDFFIGRELNPRVTLPVVGEIDIKSFMELRPGMLGWIMLDLAFMAKQYKSYGYVTDSIVMVVIAQALYTFDALYMEPAILTTMDITTDGFGFMLSFGDLVWVPFIYSLQARYLSTHPVMLGPAYIALILGVAAVGFYIFRSTNNEKNRFRTNPSDPKVAHLSSIKTSTGSRLITSGWWGKARHINYLGDFILSWAYCLPTLAAGYKLTPSVMYPGTRLVSTEGMKGAAIPITYFYLIYFAVLLVHRERRDEEKCHRKYGKDWEEYCRIVRWRIIPGVY